MLPVKASHITRLAGKSCGLLLATALGLACTVPGAADTSVTGEPQQVGSDQGAGDGETPPGAADGGRANGQTSGEATDGGVAEPSEAPAVCPAGLGGTWTCDGGSRVRCTDDHLESEACEFGCAAGAAGEAVCSCGTHPRYPRWNCMPDGNRASCAGGVAWVVDSCGGQGCTASPNGVSDACVKTGALADKVSALGASCGALVPGMHCGISVRDLVTNERAGYGENTLYVSASSAKAFWVGAALHDRTIADVAPHAHKIFAYSDNSESGRVIDLLASPDRVNTFQWQDAKLADVGFCSWDFDKNRDAHNCPGIMGGDNFLSTNDAVSYLSQIWDHSLLGAEKSVQLLEWMKLSPRRGYGGWLGTQLPEAARASMHHKAGWLPPAAVRGYSNANDIGIIEVPGGHAYAVAFALQGAKTQTAYDKQELPLLEYLSCAVYHAVEGTDASACIAP